ncbi:YVTN repeat-like/Quino protein amine dehydrogenase, partial [Leucogyrophana mollusca]
LAYSPDGHWIATASLGPEQVVHLGDAGTGRQVREPLECDDRIAYVGFSPDGLRIAIGLRNGSFEVFDTATGECLGKAMLGHEIYVADTESPADGQRIVSAGYDSTVQAWDWRHDDRLKNLRAGSLANSVQFFPGGRYTVNVSNDGEMSLWDTES